MFQTGAVFLHLTCCAYNIHPTYASSIEMRVVGLRPTSDFFNYEYNLHSIVQQCFALCIITTTNLHKSARQFVMQTQAYTDTHKLHIPVQCARPLCERGPDCHFVYMHVFNAFRSSRGAETHRFRCCAGLRWFRPRKVFTRACADAWCLH